MNIIKYLLFGMLLMSTNLTAQENNQTQDFAKARSKQVGAIDYDLRFSFQPGKKHYDGEATLTVELKKEGDLTIDFSGKSINSVSVENKPITDFVFSNATGTLLIGQDHLGLGKQHIEISFTGTYSHQGQGLHQFVDPADGLEYLYTHLEPNDAHRVFPCFDQPDLRATYRFQVTAPHDWVVVSNGSKEREIRDGDRTRTIFKKTKPFSTYITQLTVGPYAAYYDQGFRYPLALYCRQSLASYLNPELWFETTRRGFDFFEEYFQIPYPFEKYDQIFCPEYNIGAMENVAAVTWNDARAIFRSKPTRDQILRRDLTLYHEMAHMWFGDLVTMEWWNDLWLKESFATYMSYLAMEAMGIEDVWTRSARSKDWAMATDQLVTTHPILATVPDVRAAASIFDGITYGKGFAVLRQLDNYLGKDIFRDGCRLYFKKYSWQAVTLDEFIGSLEEAAGFSLKRWVDVWLGKKGLNTAQLHYDIKDGVIENARIEQMPSRFNDVLRPHTMDLGLYHDKGNKIGAPTETMRITYDGVSTPLPALNGKPAPALIVGNITDIDFTKVVFDAHSLQWLRENMGRISSSSTRKTIWRTLWAMVEDQRFHPKEYLQLAMAQIPSENNSQVLGTLLSTAGEVIFTQIPDEEEVRSKQMEVFDLCRQALATQTPGSGSQLILFEALVDHAYSSSQRAYMDAIREGKETIEGLPMTHSRKWQMLRSMAHHDHEKAMDLAKVLGEEDKSAEARNAQLAISALQPNSANKVEVWQRITHKQDLSLNETFALASGFFSRTQRELTKPFIQQYFEDLPTIYKKREYAFARRFASILFPRGGAEQTVAAARVFLERDDLDKTLKDMVHGQLDSLERTLRIRATWNDTVAHTRTL